jgi:hypothetical protein
MKFFALRHAACIIPYETLFMLKKNLIHLFEIFNFRNNVSNIMSE